LIIRKGLFGASRGNVEMGFSEAIQQFQQAMSVIPKIAEAIQDDSLIEAAQGFASVAAIEKAAYTILNQCTGELVNPIVQ
jgi:hypothetical protein